MGRFTSTGDISTEFDPTHQSNVQEAQAGPILTPLHSSYRYLDVAATVTKSSNPLHNGLPGGINHGNANPAHRRPVE